MAIVTETIRNNRWNKDIEVTYDNEIIRFTFNENNSEFNFINGYEININKGQVRFYRDDRGTWYETGILDKNTHTSGITITPEERDYVKYFKINVNVINTTEYIIDLTESDLRNLTDYEYIGDVEPEPEPEEPEPEPEPEPEEPDKVITISQVEKQGDSGNWEVNLYDGMEVTLPFIVEMKPKPNYRFTGIGKLDYYDEFGTPLALGQDFGTERYSASFTIKEDKYSKHGNNTYVIRITLQTEYEEVEQVSQFVNVYNPNDLELNSLSAMRFYDNNGYIIDYGEYIYNLIEIPFTIPESMIAGRSPIRLGELDSTILANVLNGYLLTIDLGEITVNETYENMLDYANVSAELYIPLGTSITLDIDYVMNQTVRIEYIINLYSGECTINLYSTFTDSLFHTETQKLGIDLPFISSGQNKIQINTGTYNTIDSPYIVIIKDRTIDDYEEMGVGTSITGTIGSHSGYVEISDIDLDSKATNQEQSEIKSILSNGVYINGENS